MEWVVVGIGEDPGPGKLETYYNRAAEIWPDRAFTLVSAHVPRDMTLRSGRQLAYCWIIAVKRTRVPDAPRKPRKRRT